MTQKDIEEFGEGAQTYTCVECKHHVVLDDVAFREPGKTFDYGTSGACLCTACHRAQTDAKWGAR